MDERLKQALDFSNYMVTLQNQKRILKEQHEENLIYYFNGGQFTASKTLISFCYSLIGLNQTETILVDDNDIPIEIENLAQFTENILNVYNTATNLFLTEYNKLKKNKSVEGLVL